MDEFEAAPAEPTPIVEAPAEPAPEPKEPAEPKRTRADAIADALKKAGVTGTRDDERGAEEEGAAREAKPEKAEKADDGPARNPDGTFKAKDQAESATEKPADGDKPEAKAEAKPGADAAPARFSGDAKAEWEKAPASVRGEINRAIRELETGLQQKDAQIAPLKKWIDMAAEQGADLSRAIGNYVEMEQTLRKDPGAGLQAIARNMGMTLPELIAEATGGQAPTGDMAAKDREILRLSQQVNEMGQRLQQLTGHVEGQRMTSIESQVQAFANEHPRFDELAPTIARLMETGMAEGLEDAYDMAERLNPASQPQPQAAPTPPAQTRQVRSVTGAPSAGSDPAIRKPSATRMDAIARGFAGAGLS